MRNLQLINLRMPVKDLEQLDKIADNLGEGRSSLIRRAVHTFIEDTLMDDAISKVK